MASKGVISLSNQPWTWHPDFLQRWHERRQYIVDNIVRDHIDQSYQGDPDLSEMKPIDQMRSLYQWANDGQRFRQRDAYKNLHKKLVLRFKNQEVVSS